MDCGNAGHVVGSGFGPSTQLEALHLWPPIHAEGAQTALTLSCPESLTVPVSLFVSLTQVL